MKNSLMTLCLLALSVATVEAQSIETFRKQLNTPDPSYGSRIQVVEHGTAATVVQAAQVAPSDAKVQGYRIRIFFDNSQKARSAAEAAMARFAELYPGIPAYMTYTSPNFMVTVGNCLTSEEANILWGRIKEAFDRAFVVREEIPLTLIGATPAKENSTETPAE